MESPPAFLVLGDVVQDYAYIDRTAFRMVKCRRQEAYGCGHNGDGIVRGLALFVRLGRDDDAHISPKLSLSASDEVMELVGSEIDDHSAKLYGRQLSLSAKIYTVSGSVMVIRISFSDSYTSQDFRSYYLVYDSAAASLSLLPRRPPSCRPSCTTTPLKVKVREDEYSLVLMAEMSEERSRATSVLCLWSPPSPDDNRFHHNSRTPWQLKGRQGAKAFPNPFKANVVFMFKGTAVWGDLSQGIMYCDCSDLINGADHVDFKHIMLPRECRISAGEMDVLDHCSLVVHRTMGCVGDSIWFVIIKPNFTCPGQTVVKVWTLDLLAAGEKKWNPHREFKMLELSRAQGYGRRHPVPETVPKFPFLRRQQAHCGGLYMLLPKPNTGGKPYCDLVCIDLSSHYEVRLQSKRRMVIPLMNNPVILDLDFFNPCHLAA